MRKISKVVVTTIAATLALSLTSCAGAGPNAATRQITRVTDGGEAVIFENGNDIRISNLLLVHVGESTTVLVGNIVNRSEEADQLLTITTASTRAVITGETLLRTNKPLFFEGESANSKAVLFGEDLKAGSTVEIGLGFARAGRVIVRVIVRDQSDIYAGITSEAIPSAPATK
jgi:hypothetical protein